MVGSGGHAVRILITGSRKWDDRLAVDEAIGLAWATSADPLVVVHGGCRTGVDTMADAFARQAGIEVEVFEPNPAYGWQRWQVRN